MSVPRKHMVDIPLDFSIRYGLCFATLADERDADRFNPTDVDLGPYLDSAARDLEDAAREEGEFDLVRPWLEYLISSGHKDIQALGIEDVRSLADIVLSHPGVGAMPINQWHHVLEYMRQKVFKIAAPMTEEEKARARREVTITTEPLADFRKRRRTEGHLPASPDGS